MQPCGRLRPLAHCRRVNRPWPGNPHAWSPPSTFVQRPARLSAPSRLQSAASTASSKAWDAPFAVAAHSRHRLLRRADWTRARPACLADGYVPPGNVPLRAGIEGGVCARGGKERRNRRTSSPQKNRASKSAGRAVLQRPIRWAGGKSSACSRDAASGWRPRTETTHPSRVPPTP